MNVSPITVHYYKERPNLLSLLVQIFSVVGGIFMIAKLFDTVISSLWTPANIVEADGNHEFDLDGPKNQTRIEMM